MFDRLRGRMSGRKSERRTMANMLRRTGRGSPLSFLRQLRKLQVSVIKVDVYYSYTQSGSAGEDQPTNPFLLCLNFALSIKRSIVPDLSISWASMNM